MSSKTSLLDRQRRWASEHGFSVDANGYLADLSTNLFRPLSESAKMSFTNGGGSELRARDDVLPKMHALHSSAALVVNVFDHWDGSDLAPLVSALGLQGQASRLEFECPFPTGLGGIPPNLDVAIWFEGGSVLAIESKFSEWLAAKPTGKDSFRASYFEPPPGRWQSVRLPRCEALARDIVAGTTRFVALDVAQLLKHALGLAHRASQNNGAHFTLYYLFLDVKGPESGIHREEISRFERLIGADLDFRWSSYQDVFARLAGEVGREVAHSPYLGYMRERYFSS